MRAATSSSMASAAGSTDRRNASRRTSTCRRASKLVDHCAAQIWTDIADRPTLQAAVHTHPGVGNDLLGKVTIATQQQRQLHRALMMGIKHRSKSPVTVNPLVGPFANHRHHPYPRTNPPGGCHQVHQMSGRPAVLLPSRRLTRCDSSSCAMGEPSSLSKSAPLAEVPRLGARTDRAVDAAAVPPWSLAVDAHDLQLRPRRRLRRRCHHPGRPLSRPTTAARNSHRIERGWLCPDLTGLTTPLGHISRQRPWPQVPGPHRLARDSARSPLGPPRPGQAVPDVASARWRSSGRHRR